MRRIVFVLTLVIALAACGIARADYVTSVALGHGPFPCVGTTPPVGVADISDGAGNCERWIGDIGVSGHPGYVITPTVSATHMQLSASEPGHTYGYACPGLPSGPPSDPCQGQTVAYFNNQSFASNVFQWPAKTIVLGYMLGCTNPGGIVSARACTGSATPLDGSGYPTAVLSDQFGNHLKNQDGPVASNCLVDLMTYGLGYGVWAVVYACP